MLGQLLRCSRWVLALIIAMALSSCGSAEPTEAIYVVVTSTTPLAATLTETPPPVIPTSVPSITPVAEEMDDPSLGASPSPTSPSAETCSGAPTARLSIGLTGRVTITNGLPVNVRESAGIDMAQIGAMPEGTEFAVVNGPVCADSMWWWNIDAATGLGGWAAEGDSTGYFLEPYP